MKLKHLFIITAAFMVTMTSTAKDQNTKTGKKRKTIQR